MKKCHYSSSQNAFGSQFLTWHGKIYDESCFAIHRAVIKLVDTHYNPIKHTLSDKNGSFMLICPRNFEGYLIIAKNGYKTKLFTYNEENRMSMVILKTLPSTCFVMGVVAFRNACCFSPCCVTLQNNCFKFKTFTDYEGRFFLKNVRKGHYQLKIENESYQTRIIKVSIENSFLTQLPLIIMSKKDIGCTIHGLIKFRNRPISDINVFLVDASNNSCIAYTKSNSHGLYFFGNLNLGKYYVMAVG